MLREFETVPGGSEVLPFVLMFCGLPKSCLWEEPRWGHPQCRAATGVNKATTFCHLLFALEQHPALVGTEAGCALPVLERIVPQSNPDARVWKLAGLPEVDHGARSRDTSWAFRICGSSVGDSGGRTQGVLGQNLIAPRSAVRVVIVVALRISQSHTLHQGGSSGM